MLKGRAIIELRNKDTGEVKSRFESDNIVTDVYKFWLYEYMRKFSHGGTDGIDDSDLYNKVIKFFGGVYVFNDNIAEDKTHMDSDVISHLIGYAGSNTSADLATKMQGTFDDISVDLNNNSITFSWDFSGDVCNGYIKCICLGNRSLASAAMFSKDYDSGGTLLEVDSEPEFSNVPIFCSSNNLSYFIHEDENNVINMHELTSNYFGALKVAGAMDDDFINYIKVYQDYELVDNYYPEWQAGTSKRVAYLQYSEWTLTSKYCASALFVVYVKDDAPGSVYEDYHIECACLTYEGELEVFNIDLKDLANDFLAHNEDISFNMYQNEVGCINLDDKEYNFLLKDYDNKIFFGKATSSGATLTQLTSFDPVYSSNMGVGVLYPVINYLGFYISYFGVTHVPWKPVIVPINNEESTLYLNKTDIDVPAIRNGNVDNMVGNNKYIVPEPSSGRNNLNCRFKENYLATINNLRSILYKTDQDTMHITYTISEA